MRFFPPLIYDALSFFNSNKASTERSYLRLRTVCVRWCLVRTVTGAGTGSCPSVVVFLWKAWKVVKVRAIKECWHTDAHEAKTHCPSLEVLASARFRQAAVSRALCSCGSLVSLSGYEWSGKTFQNKDWCFGSFQLLHFYMLCFYLPAKFFDSELFHLFPMAVTSVYEN